MTDSEISHLNSLITGLSHEVNQLDHDALKLQGEAVEHPVGVELDQELA